MKHGSLFSGIGGFDLAAEWMGWQNIFHCEIGEFPRKILKHHFPNSICYEDIKKTDFRKHRGEVDIISGGFPCQPYSNAGKRRGKEDDRHLWPEMLRVIREIQPRFVVGENVAGLLSWNNGMVFHEIITDLENEGYETQAFLIPACATNAPHRRDRIWFVAYSSSNGRNKRGETINGREINKFQNRDKIRDKITSNGKQSNAPHTDGSRINRKEKHEDNNKNSRDWEQSNNTNNNGEVWRTTPHTDGTEQGNNIGENIGKEGEIRWGEESNVLGELCSDGNVAYTNGIRGNKDAWRIDGESDVINQNGKARDVLHTDNTVKSGKYIGQKRKGQFDGSNSRIGINNFENFPTQSPICGGDDGISTELDGITFSKWRNESIKGYGNAVVPQVVYQIFKAIEKSLL